MATSHNFAPVTSFEIYDCLAAAQQLSIPQRVINVMRDPNAFPKIIDLERWGMAIADPARGATLEENFDEDSGKSWTQLCGVELFGLKDRHTVEIIIPGKPRRGKIAERIATLALGSHASALVPMYDVKANLLIPRQK